MAGSFSRRPGATRSSAIFLGRPAIFTAPHRPGVIRFRSISRIHVCQLRGQLFTHGPRYLVSKAYRQACEMEA